MNVNQYQTTSVWTFGTPATVHKAQIMAFPPGLRKHQLKAVCHWSAQSSILSVDIETSSSQGQRRLDSSQKSLTWDQLGHCLVQDFMHTTAITGLNHGTVYSGLRARRSATSRRVSPRSYQETTFYCFHIERRRSSRNFQRHILVHTLVAGGQSQWFTSVLRHTIPSRWETGHRMARIVQRISSRRARRRLPWSWVIWYNLRQLVAISDQVGQKEMKRHVRHGTDVGSGYDVLRNLDQNKWSKS